MGSSFETSDGHAQAHLRPLRVAMRADQVFEEARNLAHDLPGWTIQSADEARRVIVCRRRKRFLSGESTVTIRCEGPEGVPSTVVHVRSETGGGVLARDKSNVLEFLVPFQRRVG